MGDSTNQGLESTYSSHRGAGMDALISAIEFQQQSVAKDIGRFSMMANMQDQATAGRVAAEDDVEIGRLRAQLTSQQQVAAALYHNLTPSALAAVAGGVSSPMWDNPMLMPFVPSLLACLRPGAQAQSNLRPTLPTATTLPKSRPTLPITDSVESSDVIKTAEVPNMSHGPPRLPNFSAPGLLGTTADTITATADVDEKSLQYSSVGQYLGIPGHQDLLTSTTSGLVPSMNPALLNAACLGTFGAYSSYYQNALLQRLPHMLRLCQNQMLGISSNNEKLAPIQNTSQTLKSSFLCDSPMRHDDGYLPVKQSLKQRLSAPNPGTESHFGLACRNDALARMNPGVKSSSVHSCYLNNDNLPSRLIVSSPKPHKPLRHAQLDTKSIEQRISDIISENEKILCSPTLEKVKPRRVFRRNSLDPPVLHTPTRSHPPLTATHSAPRKINAKCNSPLLTERTTTSERPNFLTISSEPLALPQSSSSQRMRTTTVMPAPGRDPTIHSHISGITGKRHFDDLLARTTQSQFGITEGPFRCRFCGAHFLQYTTYEAHTTTYCTKRPSSAAKVCARRQSVIQHTALQADEKSCASPTRVEVPDSRVISLDNASSKLPSPLEPPKRYIRKDLYRTRSADATIDHRPDKALVTMDSAMSDPYYLSSSILQKFEAFPTSLSSIPTDKLPPKKKQLQLMRNCRSSESHFRSTGHNLSPLACDTLTTVQEAFSGASEESAPISQLSTSRKIDPPSSLVLDASSNLKTSFIPLGMDASSNQKTLPSSIPCEMDAFSNQNNLPSCTPCGTVRKTCPLSSSISPTIYMTQPSPTHVGKFLPNTAVLSTPTKESPRSPTSPSKHMSPSFNFRSSSRSPTSPGLESTIPRSNYKLLLHQLSLRNQQDMGYLSEAYRHSKDKKLKRNIASLLWSSAGTHSLGTNRTSAKRICTDGGLSMEDLYPGKASLARRLSPNTDTSSLSISRHGSLSPVKMPVAESRSRTYESTLRVNPTVTQSHSTGHASNVTDNIKQFLKNKNRNQQTAREKSASSQCRKGHKPLTRTNANACYLLKSPTNAATSLSADAMNGVETKSDLEARKSLTDFASVDATHGLKESFALKRTSSLNSELSGMNHQNKRQKLVPISKQSAIQASLPKALVMSQLTDCNPGKSEFDELSKIKSVNSTVVQAPFSLQPHGSPSLGFEPHPTFCSLVSPQPTYIELQQSTLSMYSQWAVSEPLLPKGMTILDIFRNTKFLKALSPFISHNSLFTFPKQLELHVTDTKDYKYVEKEVETVHQGRTELVGTKQSQLELVEDLGAKMTKGDPVKREKFKGWLHSQMVEAELFQTSSCYTSCHNKVSQKLPEQTSNFVLKPNVEDETPKTDKKMDTELNLRNFPNLPPPKVIIHPPSPSDSSSSDSTSGSHHQSLKISDISVVEFSDCDMDDDVTKKRTQQPFTVHERVSTPPRFTPPTKNSPKQSCSVVGGQTIEENRLNLREDLNTVILKDDISPKRDPSTSQVSSSIVVSGTRPMQPRLINAVDKSSSNRECIGQSTSLKKDDAMSRRNKKVWKTRKEWNDGSSMLERRNDGMPDSPCSSENAGLEVYPSRTCSDDSTKVCARCLMKIRRDPEDKDDGDYEEDNCCGACGGSTGGKGTTQHRATSADAKELDEESSTLSSKLKSSMNFQSVSSAEGFLTTAVTDLNSLKPRKPPSEVAMAIEESATMNLELKSAMNFQHASSPEGFFPTAVTDLNSLQPRESPSEVTMATSTVSGVVQHAFGQDHKGLNEESFTKISELKSAMNCQSTSSPSSLASPCGLLSRVDEGRDGTQMSSPEGFLTTPAVTDLNYSKLPSEIAMATT